MTVEVLQTTYPALAWRRFFTSLFLFSANNAAVTRVVVVHPAYFAALDALLADISETDLQAYLQWRAVSAWLSAGGTEFLDILADFNRVLRGIESRPPLRQQCQGVVGAAFGFSIGRAFVEERFSSDSKVLSPTTCRRSPNPPPPTSPQPSLSPCMLLEPQSVSNVGDDDDAMFKAMTEEMVLHIKTAFEAHLADVEWLGQAAREKATEKAEA